MRPNALSIMRSIFSYAIKQFIKNKCFRYFNTLFITSAAVLHGTMFVMVPKLI